MWILNHADGKIQKMTLLDIDTKRKKNEKKCEKDILTLRTGQ